MKAVDSSVAVAGCASWHESHDVARRTLDAAPRLVAHCGLETYSVLTRLPGAFRVEGPLVVGFLQDRFVEPPLSLSPESLQGLVADLAERGISGGAVYDGLVARTAAAHGATLLTFDRRAEQTYRRCDVRYQVLA